MDVAAEHKSREPAWYYGRFPYVRTIRSDRGAVHHQTMVSEEDEAKWLRMVKGVQEAYPDAGWTDDDRCSACFGV